MTKTKVILLIIFLTPIFAGLYGIIHDQLTYSISHEYYTKFKFYQFGLALKGEEAIFPYPRLQVSKVGFLATWWVGLIMGIIFGLVGLSHKDPKVLFRTLLRSIFFALIIAFLIGLIGLWVGANLNVHNFYFPLVLNDEKSFLMVGCMHNFSYIGGLIGLIVGIVYIIRKRKSPVI